MPADTLRDRVNVRLRSRQQRSILRRLSEPENLIDFSSNDYLGLSKHPALRSQFLNSLTKRHYVMGAGGSRLLDGNTSEHIALEGRLAEFFGAPALLYNSGFDANVGFFSCVPQQGDTILYDALIHASVHDGMRASRVPESHRLPFEHNSIDSLRSIVSSVLKNDERLRRGTSVLWLAVESLYSMDGDFAPLNQIADVVEELLPAGNGHIVVDEAHATGIYGPAGRGIVAMLGLESRILVRLHTFGKALASNGAAILAPSWLREYLINYSRPLIYTTALAGYNAIAVQSSFDILESPLGQKLSSDLQNLSSYFLSRLREMLFDVPNAVLLLSPGAPRGLPRPSTVSFISPIIPLLTPHPRDLSQHLRKRCQILARPITYPTVPRGEERVRVCIHSNNTKDQVDSLLDGIRTWIVTYSTAPSAVMNTYIVNDVLTKARL